MLLNGEVLSKTSYILQEQDTFSIKAYGKYRFQGTVGKTKKDLPVPDFDCKFEASLECTIEKGTFKMKVDYTGDSVTSFTLLEKPVRGSYLPYSIDEIAQEIDETLCDLREEYGF